MSSVTGGDLETPPWTRCASESLASTFLLTLICGRKTPRTRCSLDEAISLLNSAYKKGDNSKSNLSSAIKDGIQGRRLLLLDDRVIGSGPEEAQVGDAVCILYGCSVPVCLRPVLGTENWEFVGE